MRFRYARHTKNLSVIKDFYTNILNLEVLGSFENHDNYDEIFLGKNGENWHLEFTVSEDIPEQKFDEDDLLVFYPQSQEEYQKILDNIQSNNIKTLEPKNPYWKINGLQINDPDGFGIMISNQLINN